MKVKIGDICTLKSGTSLKEDILNESNGVPYIKVSDMNLVGNEKYIVRANSYADESISEKMLFPKGTVLFPKRGGAIGTNKKRIASKTVCADLNTMGVIPSDKIRPLYLYYYFQNIDFGTLYNGSSVPQINNTDIAPMEINLIPLEEQDDIVALLEKTDDIVRKRKEELSALDNLIKARFVEMFGSINNNVHGFDIRTLQDVCEQIKDGTHQTPTYTEDIEKGFKFLSSKDVTSGRIDWSKIKYIPADLHEELYERIKPQKGDILLAKNGTTGVAAVVETDDVFDIYVSLALLRPIDMNSVYLWAAINSDETKHQFDGSIKGIGVPNLHLGEIKKTKIIVPPIELQNEFEQFVKQVDKSKVAVQKSLDEAQLLFDSLMQQYFG